MQLSRPRSPQRVAENPGRPGQQISGHAPKSPSRESAAWLRPALRSPSRESAAALHPDPKVPLERALPSRESTSNGRLAPQSPSGESSNSGRPAQKCPSRESSGSGRPAPRAFSRDRPVEFRDDDWMSEPDNFQDLEPHPSTPTKRLSDNDLDWNALIYDEAPPMPRGQANVTDIDDYMNLIVNPYMSQEEEGKQVMRLDHISAVKLDDILAESEPCEPWLPAVDENFPTFSKFDGEQVHNKSMEARSDTKDRLVKLQNGTMLHGQWSLRSFLNSRRDRSPVSRLLKSRSRSQRAAVSEPPKGKGSMSL